MSESFAQLLEESFANQKIKTGAILTGVVVGVNADMVIVNGGTSDQVNRINAGLFPETAGVAHQFPAAGRGDAAGVHDAQVP